MGRDGSGVLQEGTERTVPQGKCFPAKSMPAGIVGGIRRGRPSEEVLWMRSVSLMMASRL